MSPVLVDSIPISISWKSLRREIQGPRKGPLTSRLKAQLQRAVHEIRALARPRALYKMVPIEAQDGSATLSKTFSLESRKLATVFDPCQNAAVFLVTLGPEVDAAIKNAMVESPHYGYVLDTAASMAVESAAEYVQETIGTRVAENQSITRRYSPGYCDWDLEGQEQLFEMLPHRRIDVSLSETYYMEPRKSISGIIGICPREDLADQGNACARCDRTDCPYRREN